MTDNDQPTYDEKQTLKRLELFVKAAERAHPSTDSLIWRSFVQGMFFALGTTIGLSIIIALLSFILSQAKLIPGIKDFINTSKVEQVIPSPEPSR